jgi:hypothetical protein
LISRKAAAGSGLTVQLGRTDGLWLVSALLFY